GTLAGERDSNGDGIDDFVALRMGLDPMESFLGVPPVLAPATVPIASSSASSGGATGGFGSSTQESNNASAASAAGLPVGLPNAHGTAHTTTSTPDLGWEVRGGGVETGDSVMLTEEAGLLSQAIYTFVVPETPSKLRFRVHVAALGTNATGPSDV